MLALLGQRQAGQAPATTAGRVAHPSTNPQEKALLVAAGALGWQLLLVAKTLFTGRGGGRSGKASPAKPSSATARRPALIVDKHAGRVPPLVLPGSSPATKGGLIAASPGRSSSAGTPHSRGSAADGAAQQREQVQREQLAAAAQTIAQLERQLDVVCREARLEVKHAANEAAKAREAAAGMEKELELAVRQAAALQARTKALMSDKTAAERGCRELQGQLAGLQSTLTSNMRAYQQQVEVLQHKLQEASKARDATDAQLSKLRKTAAAQEHRKQQGSAAKERLRAEAELAREESAELRRACFELQERLEAQRSAAAESGAALAAAQSQIRRLEAEVRELQARLLGSNS